jgi:hypothetical protein
MTNHLPNDLSHLSDAEFNALCPQGEHAPGPEPLSPAAQAVVKAVDHHETNHWLTPREVAAAAFRAAAEKIEDLYCKSDVDSSDGVVFALRQLVLLADELESQ